MSGLSCRDARNLFDAHLNGELSAALETELNVHRVSCPQCRQELALLEVAGQVIAAEETGPRLDDEFADRLLACVAARPKRRMDRARLIRIGLRGLAAAACVGLVAGYLIRPAPRVAGSRYAAPSAAARSAPAAPRKVSPEERFQAQLQRALTEWRKDASSLRKVYDFITPQIVEEMGLDPAEGIHDQADSFEPDASNPADSVASSGAEIEDI